MLFMDMPEVPPQYTQVIVAQVSQVKAPGTERTIGVCHPIENSLESRLSAVNSVSPVGAAYTYLKEIERRKIDDAAYLAAKMTLVQAPTHGELGLYNQTKTGRYLSGNYSYLGPDSATVLVEIGSYKVKVIYHFVLMQNVPGSGEEGEATDEKSICPNGYKWRISTASDANGNTTINSVEYLPADGTSAAIDPSLATSFDASSYLSNFISNTSNVTLSFADLAGGALGQTTGTSITLDDNAAGHNWFIDTTPWSNEEYLPTSNPNEWVAKVGSAAYGKMDMLSVLLQEYGHALGIDHSADSRNFMATTLTPGVRRMPSADELTLMQQLVGGVKNDIASVTTRDSNSPLQLPLLPLGGFGLAFLGRLRGTRYGSLNVEADLSTLVVNYAVSANAKLTSGTFTSTNGLPPQNGWTTQGLVDFTNGTATLQEDTARQTRLNQVFVVNPRDRFLSFTIAGTVLDDVTGAPDDVFEVALLDANTGASLLGSNGLTRSDAFLNLQADGTERLSAGVTRTLNQDGSRTYRIDLAGIAVGTAVNLSFDLIGFGKASSHVTVTVSNVSVGDASSLPVLHDDAPTMAEDGTLAFNPFAQVDNSSTLVLGSHVVDQAAHGTVTVNTDGTFTYTPAANYFGSDSFTYTYTINDGSTVSNLATVNVTVTAVNDAPVAADVYASATEDTPLVITLGNFASDVDNPSPHPSPAGGEGVALLTTQIVTGPTHGVLLANADGSYTYTPDANYNGLDSFTYKANDGALDSNVASVNLTVTPVNDAPVTNNVAAYTVEDNILVLNLLNSASDIDSPVLTPQIVDAPAHGILTQNADGTYTYTPNAPLSLTLLPYWAA